MMLSRQDGAGIEPEMVGKWLEKRRSLNRSEIPMLLRRVPTGPLDVAATRSNSEPRGEATCNVRLVMLRRRVAGPQVVSYRRHTCVEPRLACGLASLPFPGRLVSTISTD